MHTYTRVSGMLSSGSRTHRADMDFIHGREDLTIASTSLWLFPSWKDAAIFDNNQWYSSPPIL